MIEVADSVVRQTFLCDSVAVVVQRQLRWKDGVGCDALWLLRYDDREHKVLLLVALASVALASVALASVALASVALASVALASVALASVALASVVLASVATGLYYVLR